MYRVMDGSLFKPVQPGSWGEQAGGGCSKLLGDVWSRMSLSTIPGMAGMTGLVMHCARSQAPSEESLTLLQTAALALESVEQSRIRARLRCGGRIRPVESGL